MWTDLLRLTLHNEYLMVAPTSRHLDFLLSAVEAWLNATRTNLSMWDVLGIGRKVAEWFDKAGVDGICPILIPTS